MVNQEVVVIQEEYLEQAAGSVEQAVYEGEDRAAAPDNQQIEPEHEHEHNHEH